MTALSTALGRTKTYRTETLPNGDEQMIVTDPSGLSSRSVTRKDHGLVTSYEYDVVGNLRRATLPTGRVVEYVIDGSNRRVGKRVDGAMVQGLLYAGALKPIAELDGNGSVVSRFDYGSSPLVPDYLVKGGTLYRILSDHLGSPRIVVNAATGSVAQRMDFDQWGNVVRDTSPGFQPFGFTGGIYDRDVGLVRYGARDYDATVGRWTAKDPSGLAAGTNLYMYGSNDPVNHVDPNGREPVTIIIVAVAVAVVAALVTIVGAGVFAPSDTSKAPSNVVGLASIVPGLGAAVVGAAKVVFGGLYDVLGLSRFFTRVKCPPASSGEFVNLASAERTTHITVGDATGGGHMWPGAPGKTPFPQGWSADQIMHHVSDIATDPGLQWIQQTGKAGSLFTKAGDPALLRDGDTRRGRNQGNPRTRG